jgi:hypothetical protein
MNKIAARRIMCFVAASGLALLAAAVCCGQQTISVVEMIRTKGVVRSVSPGVIVVTDDQGQDLELKIQDRDKQGISLAGARALVRFPATVEISGELPPDALQRGTLVRFTGRVNRLGRTEGDLERLVVFDEGRYALGLEVAEQPEDAGVHATCTICGEVYSYRNGRLVVTIPKGEFTRQERLAFNLADDAEIKLESDDYRRAGSGDQVVNLSGVRFSTGDRAVKEISIRIRNAAEATSETATIDAQKYRRLSDAPARPRDVRSAHFLLHTDISDRSAQMLLDKLETMIGLVSRYYGRPPTRMIECYVVRDLSQWPVGVFPPEAVAKIREPAGVTLSVSAGSVTKAVVYSCDKHGVVQHECVHAYCSQTFGSTGPTWYAEGMAEMGHYWKNDQLAIEIDPVAIDYLKNAPPKKLLDIVAAGQITGDSWRAYAWRWALCHLLASNPNYSDRFRGLGIAMMSGQPGASFESVYGPVAREISFEYDFFVQHLDNGFRCDLCAWQWNRKFQYLLPRGFVSTKVSARYGWQATNVKLRAGESYDCAAKGTWRTSADADAVDADGDARGYGRLVGIVMKDDRLDEPFELGVRTTFVAPDEGDLYLRCRDDWNRLEDNDGELTVYFRKAVD